MTSIACAPVSCAIQIQLEELVNNEYGGQSWEPVTADNQKSAAPCKVGFSVQTPAYKCLSTATENEFRVYAITSSFTATGEVLTASSPGYSKWIYCE